MGLSALAAYPLGGWWRAAGLLASAVVAWPVGWFATGNAGRHWAIRYIAGLFLVGAMFVGLVAIGRQVESGVDSGLNLSVWIWIASVVVLVPGLYRLRFTWAARNVSVLLGVLIPAS